MLTSTIRAIRDGVQVTVGTISWDGTDIVPSPHDDETLSKILQDPVFVSGPDGMVDVYASDDPEKFVRNLYKHYKSAYFNASKAVET